MVSLALTLLSTKNLEKFKQFLILDSGERKFPNDETPSIYLDLMEMTKGSKFRFVINWTNESYLSKNGYSDTEELHGKVIHIESQPTKFKTEDVMGLRIVGVEEKKEA